MFVKNNESITSLHTHLINVSFFVDGEDTLSIIDDYHTKNIKNKAIKFYKSSFENTGLRLITFYYQIKKIKDETLEEIATLSENLNLNISELKSIFSVFIYKC